MMFKEKLYIRAMDLDIILDDKQLEQFEKYYNSGWCDAYWM